MSTGPAPLDIAGIRKRLSSLEIGSHVHYVPEVDSTNRFVGLLPGSEVRHGLLIMTEYQRLGRGRRDRAWVAPASTSILASVVLRPPSETAAGDLLMVAGLSVMDAIAAETGLVVTLKWPNDILACGKKVGGILAEGAREFGYVIIGIGVNVNFDPHEHAGIPPTATTLGYELGSEIDRSELVVALFSSMDMWYRKLTYDPDSVFGEWAKRLALAGKSLEVHDTAGSWQGVAVDVQRDGALRVRDNGGEIHTLYAADVSVRLPRSVEEDKRVR